MGFPGRAAAAALIVGAGALGYGGYLYNDYRNQQRAIRRASLEVVGRDLTDALNKRSVQMALSMVGPRPYFAFSLPWNGQGPFDASVLVKKSRLNLVNAALNEECFVDVAPTENAPLDRYPGKVIRIDLQFREPTNMPRPQPPIRVSYHGCYTPLHGVGKLAIGDK